MDGCSVQSTSTLPAIRKSPPTQSPAAANKIRGGAAPGSPPAPSPPPSPKRRRSPAVSSPSAPRLSLSGWSAALLYDGFFFILVCSASLWGMFFTKWRTL
ncbi:hypothetical protein VPH35_000874 [Triticum aestivum]